VQALALRPRPNAGDGAIICSQIAQSKYRLITSTFPYLVHKARAIYFIDGWVAQKPQVIGIRHAVSAKTRPD